MHEEAGQRRDNRDDRVRRRVSPEAVRFEHLPRRRPTLHRDARQKEEQVEPRRADAGVRPVDEDHALGREQDVVGPDVTVDERPACSCVTPAGL